MSAVLASAETIHFPQFRYFLSATQNALPTLYLLSIQSLLCLLGNVANGPTLESCNIRYKLYGGLEFQKKEIDASPRR
jgi:hypothetical protein